MAVGAYSMAILVLKAGFSLWLALPTAMLITMAFGVLTGCLRLAPSTSRSSPSRWPRWCACSRRTRAG